MQQRLFISVLVVCAMFSAVLSADTLRLKSGRTVEGTYLGGDARNIRFDSGDRVQSYSINDVSEVRFGSTDDQASLAPAPRSTSSTTTSSASATRSATSSATQGTGAQAAGTRQEIAAGTPLVLRMIDDI